MAKTYAAGLLSAMAAASGFNNITAYAEPLPQPSSSTAPPQPSPPPKPRNDHPRTTAAGFDPEPLEEAVKLLERIDKAPEGKKVRFNFIPFFHLSSIHLILHCFEFSFSLEVA